MGLPGLNYRCRACENDIIPDKEAGLLKRETAHSRQESISSHNALILETTSQDDDYDQPQSTDGVSAVVDAQQSDPENTDGPEHHSGNHNPMDHQADDTTHGRKSNSRQAGKINVRNICPYYRQGTWKHGLLSPDSAPKTTTACSRLSKHGNKGLQGCTQGQSCTNFHPKMCPSSLAKRQCFKADCKLKHMAHTVRVPKTSEQERQTHQEDGQETLADRNSFLEAVRAMRDGIMQELNQKLAALQTAPPVATSNVQNVAWMTRSRRSDARSSRWPHRRRSADGVGANATPLAPFSVFPAKFAFWRTCCTKGTNCL